MHVSLRSRFQVCKDMELNVAGKLKKNIKNVFSWLRPIYIIRK